MNSFKRLSPYIGPNIPEEIRELGKALFPEDERHIYQHEPGGWAWDDGSDTYQCELLLCDMDAQTADPGGYIAIVPMDWEMLDDGLRGVYENELVEWCGEKFDLPKHVAFVPLK